MTPPALPSPAELTPHQGTMLLLDRVVDLRPLGLTAETIVREDWFFADGRGVGAWIGLELMAQAVAAWGGIQATGRGEPVGPGFLAGSRRYRCDRAWFQPGEHLLISAEQTFQADNGMSSFDCTITIDGQSVAQATLTVFRPADTRSFVEGNAP